MGLAELLLDRPKKLYRFRAHASERRHPKGIELDLCCAAEVVVLDMLGLLSSRNSICRNRLVEVCKGVNRCNIHGVGLGP